MRARTDASKPGMVATAALNLSSSRAGPALSNRRNRSPRTSENPSAYQATSPGAPARGESAGDPASASVDAVVIINAAGKAIVHEEGSPRKPLGRAIDL